MAKIDKLNKEIDFIKSMLLVLIAIVVSITIGLINRFDIDKTDSIFYIGLTLIPTIFVVILKITRILTTKIKELGEL